MSEQGGFRQDAEPGARAGTGRAYPRRLIAESARLLDVQYRLWRRDLADPEQPLLEYGFRVSSDQLGVDGKACRYDTSDGQATILLADAIVHGGPEGGHAVAVDRKTLDLSTAWIHEWSPAARFSRGLPPDADRLVPRLISWIGGYEQWVLDTRGEAERVTVTRAWGLEGSLPSRWWRLAAEWRAVLSSSPLAG